ncbi:hypothetical protein [Streptomyces sp. Ru73]|nr:hypothetical protein [Streptomyces sp. Ru73]
MRQPPRSPRPRTLLRGYRANYEGNTIADNVPLADPGSAGGAVRRL